MDWKLELIAVPVSDIDRAKDFYVKIGFNADHDSTVSDEIRFVQLTPPGSACSIVLDLNFSDMPPGSVKGLQCVVKDAAEAREYLLSVGVEASPLDEQGWGTFVHFTDPDGNAWALQQLPEWSPSAQEGGGAGV
jgi:catechol 2,3-dioxygenase-like lactoylglutathione lyase family enzyme